LGTLGWAIANTRWQLFAAALLSGAGWGAMSAVAVNAIVSLWFVRGRPAALAVAYNGGSIGGVLFSPLWGAAIGRLGFPIARMLIGSIMAAVMWVLAEDLLSRTPQRMGLAPDGNAPGALPIRFTQAVAHPRSGLLLWSDIAFLTLAAGMALGLFAQIGLVAHLFSLMTPVLGAQQAGVAMGLATALAIAGRTLVGWIIPLGVDRRCGGMGGCRGADDRLHDFHCCGGLEHSGAVAWDRLVRHWLRQFDVIAATHCAGRVRRRGRAAGGRPHRRDLSVRLRLRAGRLRCDQ